ncbi:uncharacterized protein LOC109820465 [Asparagus officinalis]|uniref:uncharacterized protein LOC109820465 n=1 Tax=Asparagus officinalis TaxID=4686 RepID=UPI00098E08BB|nr:uncharacterized protein LOC109820465 [Asparagus officinalis]
MVISINCCLKPSSPPPPIPQVSSPLLPPRSIDNLPNRCMSIAATFLMVSFINTTNTSATTATEHLRYTEAVSTDKGKIVLWSDQIRKCPPWHLNSLENIMPENLPRQSDRRRTDGFVSNRSAPSVDGGAMRFNKSCYSL